MYVCVRFKQTVHYRDETVLRDVLVPFKRGRHTFVSYASVHWTFTFVLCIFRMCTFVNVLSKESNRVYLFLPVKLFLLATDHF